MSWDGLNDDQRSYVRYLNSLPPDAKCACGWYRLGECPETKGQWCYKADYARSRAPSSTEEEAG